MTRFEKLADAIARYRRAEIWNIRCWDAKAQINQIRDLLDLPQQSQVAVALADAESALRQLINESDAERAAAASEIHRIAKTKELK